MTELSEHGVAMAADTAATKKAVSEGGKTEFQVSHDVIKLHPIKELSAGISFYGMGLIGRTRTDVWVADFIRRTASKHTSMKSFGIALANELNSIIPPVKVRVILGFHIAGFEQTEKGSFPSAYQIINGTSPDGAFSCTQRQPPMEYKQGARLPLRGGDAAVYTKVFELLERYLWMMRTAGPVPLTVPYPDNLRMRCEYLRFEIVTVSNIYILSNQVASIGGPVTTLSISSKGIEDYETRAEITREGS
ncbi:MAG: hypothetical protein ABSA92_03410 [Candidatus Bathyarchaeia archaeon]